MERKEILEKLKSTEAEIRGNLEKAQHKKNEILAAAQKKAQRLEEDEDLRLKKEREKLLSDAKKDIQAKRQRGLKKASENAEIIKNNAQTKKAKDLFIEKFKEYVHA